jgi:hypothetical protein
MVAEPVYLINSASLNAYFECDKVDYARHMLAPEVGIL